MEVNQAKFIKGKLYQIITEDTLHIDLTGTKLSIEFSFVQPNEITDDAYIIEWSAQSHKTCLLKNGDILLCMDDKPKKMFYRTKIRNSPCYSGGHSIGFLYGKVILIPWYSYMYDLNSTDILSKHIKPI